MGSDNLLGQSYKTCAGGGGCNLQLMTPISGGVTMFVIASCHVNWSSNYIETLMLVAHSD